MYPDKIDHIETGLAYLPSMWDKSPKVRGLVSSYLKQIQELEEVYFDLLQKRGIREATGVNLDNLGDLLGEPRRGRTDEEYRQFLLSLSLVFRSGATVDDMLEVMRQFTNTDNVALFQHTPANLHLYTDGQLSDSVVATIRRAKAAGVGIQVMYDEGDSLILSDESSIVFKILSSIGDWDFDGLVYQDEKYVLVSDEGEVVVTEIDQAIEMQMLQLPSSSIFITANIGEGLCTSLSPDENYDVEGIGFSSGLELVLKDGQEVIQTFPSVNSFVRITTSGLIEPKLCVSTSTLGSKFIGVLTIRTVVTDSEDDLEGRGWLPDVFENRSTSLPISINESSIKAHYDPHMVMGFSRPGSADGFDEEGNLITFPPNTPRMVYDPVTLDFRGLLLEGQEDEVAYVSSFAGWHTQQGTWVMEIVDADNMEEVLLFDGHVTIFDVSGSGKIEVVQKGWDTGEVYVDGSFVYEITPYHGIDFQNLSEVLISNMENGSGFIKSFYWTDTVNY